MAADKHLFECSCSCSCVTVASVYIAVYESESTVTLVMEYASGGELFNYINSQSELVNSDQSGNTGGLNESEARRLFRQLVSAVQYLHEV